MGRARNHATAWRLRPIEMFKPTKNGQRCRTTTATSTCWTAHNSISRVFHDCGINSAAEVVPRIPSHLRRASQSVIKGCEPLEQRKGDSETQEGPHDSTRTQPITCSCVSRWRASAVCQWKRLVQQSSIGFVYELYRRSSS